MRVVIVGASGNLGRAIVKALAAGPDAVEIVGMARRAPPEDTMGISWVAADVTRGSLDAAFSGADAVVHLAWAIQPSHDQRFLWRTNVEGSARVFEAAARCGVKSVLYASSVGAYSPGPKSGAVDESWPTNGVATSPYGIQKAYVERLVDTQAAANPDMRFVKMRPGLVFRREVAEEVRRYFLGPLVPPRLLSPRLMKVLPSVAGLSFQAVHSEDVGEAFRLALRSDVSGAFNLAAEPVLDSKALATLFGARVVKVPPALLRVALGATWAMRLQPTGPGWLDLGLSAPTMDCGRARAELGWEPRHGGGEALVELLSAMAGSQEEVPG